MDLKIGTTLSAKVQTVTKPVEVKTTTIRNGEVMKVNGSVLVYKENGKIFTKSVPAGYKFNVEGRGETSVSDLTPGMKLTATIVTTTTTMTTEKRRAGGAMGSAPAPTPAPAPVAAAAPPAARAGSGARPEPAKKKLPKTASPMPLVGLLGGLSLAGRRRPPPTAARAKFSRIFRRAAPAKGGRPFFQNTFPSREASVETFT